MRSVAGIALVSLVVYLAAAGGARVAGVATLAQPGPGLPTFVVDPTWPKVPSQWRLGDPSSFAVDAQDRVWLLHRPRTLTGEAAAKAAPPVMVFDAAGNYVMGWGGAAPGLEWPEREHGIHVDSRGFVWIGGNNCPTNGIAGLKPVADDQLLKLAPDGKLVLQIGRSNRSTGNADTSNVHRAADAFVHAPTNEVFVADGYGNHRVIVFDATTGVFKRMWGAFGERPIDDDHCEVVTPKTVEDPGPKNFSIVHALRVSRDGVVYVADRENRRVQSFTLEGRFLKQLVKTDTLFARNLTLSPDRDQRYLYVGNGDDIAIVDRKTLTVAGSIKPAGLRNGGHQIAADSKGNLYVAQTGAGLQKLTLTSTARSIAQASGSRLPTRGVPYLRPRAAPMSLRLTLVCVAAAWVLVVAPAAAQNAAEPADAAAPATAAAPADGAAIAPLGRRPLVSTAPPEPVAPAVITRDAEGNVTVRAVRLTQPIRIDGALDERHYQDVPPMSDFVQVEPRPGQPATERTDVWVSFDDTNLYLTAKAYDSDMARLVATEMRRDSTTLFQGNDIVTFVLDPFYDRRNALTFTVNPIGGRSDSQVTNERQFSQDWNPVWTLKTARYDGYWTVEAQIPFKSIRYGEGRYQVWGLNVARTKRSKNEMSTLSRVPPARGNAAMVQMSFAATMVGLETPRAGSPIDIKPYVTASLNTNRTANPPLVNDPTAAAGLDVKYAVTQGLTGDFTLKTDFAQVEADEQQVNLTRFNLFFPEKREFFLENQGMFAFGGVQLGGNFNNNQNESAPIMFYSRRIGLNGNRIVPLEVGGRVTGRTGRYSLGVVNAYTGDEDESLPAPARETNFSVVRLRRDVLRRSSIGVIATGRSVAQNAVGRNLAYGADGLFSFYDNLTFNTYWARTQSEKPGRDDISYRAQMDYNGDRYGLQLERLAVGDDFNPELGFLRRDNQVRDFVQARFSPRPRSMSSVRRFRYQAGLNYIENRQGVLESREQEGEFVIEFQNGDQFNAGYSDLYEYLPTPFLIAPGIVLPVGGYDFANGRVGFNLGRQRLISTQALVEHGTFYNGHRTALTFSQGRVSVTNALSIEPNYSLNKVSLDQGRFTTHLLGSRITYTVTPLMFVSALVQYNSSTNSVSTNARLRWEYQPGSELFVVYNEDRNTLSTGYPGLNTRALIVKVNRLFRY